MSSGSWSRLSGSSLALRGLRYVHGCPMGGGARFIFEFAWDHCNRLPVCCTSLPGMCNSQYDMHIPAFPNYSSELPPEIFRSSFFAEIRFRHTKERSCWRYFLLFFELLLVCPESSLQADRPKSNTSKHNNSMTAISYGETLGRNELLIDDDAGHYLISTNRCKCSTWKRILEG